MRSIAVVVLGGVVTAIVLFVGTSSTSARGYLGFCQPAVAPGFDPWTGEPHGGILECTILDGPTTRDPGEVPDDLMGRRAVPLPVGFTVGAVIVLVWLTNGWIAGRRRASNSETASGGASR